MNTWQAFMRTPGYWRYVARRVLAGARMSLRDEQRLERWLEARAWLNH